MCQEWNTKLFSQEQHTIGRGSATKDAQLTLNKGNGEMPHLLTYFRWRDIAETAMKDFACCLKIGKASERFFEGYS